ncbi:hypothetical protein C4D60_Mb05t00770 [Musa balbisiana]|uniref:Alpha-soluble NSF attachment protein n=1 Tax=Musa balbisiana TaxID=52838 RepID=A0A4S8JST3_MUSBA|nr:hypothetical protein C4D60_Mb05t00770 [Musa balbisiana]
MADQTEKGDELEQKAEKTLGGWGIFGNKYDDAADLFDKAANCFKLAKNCILLSLSLSSISFSAAIALRERAGSVYFKLADCHLKLDSKHEAASAYVDAANCYKKISIQDAIQSLNQAVKLFLEIGRLNMAARYYKAADLFQSEEVTTSANQCKQKVAQFAAQMEQYPKAIEIYEALARHSVNNSLLRYGVKGILLNAGICHLCKGDVVAITNALERYQEIDPTFLGTREYKLLADLADSMDEGDVAKFTDAAQEYDSMTRLDPWKTTLLLRVKNAIKAKEEEEEADDLT